MARLEKKFIDKMVQEMSEAFRIPPHMLDDGFVTDDSYDVPYKFFGQHTHTHPMTPEMARQWDRQNLPTGPMKAVTEFTVVKTERNKL